jgi:anaerobic selenocysteine-containing dehydrogenase
MSLRDQRHHRRKDSKTGVRFIQGNSNHIVNQGVLCVKGSAGVMKQNSPAKLQHPMIRRLGKERGEGMVDPISWDDALNLVTKRLAHVRATDPKSWRASLGAIRCRHSPNWAAHGGFCSVNMAAAGPYSIGYSFWEFGSRSWDRAKYFVLWGVAEDHSSNPIKIGLGKMCWLNLLGDSSFRRSPNPMAKKVRGLHRFDRELRTRSGHRFFGWFPQQGGREVIAR